MRIFIPAGILLGALLIGIYYLTYQMHWGSFLLLCFLMLALSGGVIWGAMKISQILEPVSKPEFVQNLLGGLIITVIAVFSLSIFAGITFEPVGKGIFTEFLYSFEQSQIEAGLPEDQLDILIDPLYYGLNRWVAISVCFFTVLVFGSGLSVVASAWFSPKKDFRKRDLDNSPAGLRVSMGRGEAGTEANPEIKTEDLPDETLPQSPVIPKHDNAPFDELLGVRFHNDKGVEINID